MKTIFTFLVLGICSWYIENPAENVFEKLVIEGDFNGDGEKEKIYESFVSSFDNQEIVLEHTDDYEYLVEQVVKLSPKVSLKCSDRRIESLQLSENAQLFGVSWLRNIGDVNGDGSDEISVVIDWADWSSVNWCLIYTYKSGGWVEMDKFEIREWQLIKHENKKPFEGFVKRNRSGEFEVSMYDWEAGEVVKRRLKLAKSP